MGTYRVENAAFVQTVIGPDGRPATQVRTHGEVFEMDDDAAGRVQYLTRMADDTPPSAPVALPTSYTDASAPVRLATGQGPVLTVADFRSVEAASVGTVVGVETTPSATVTSSDREARDNAPAAKADGESEAAKPTRNR